MTAQIFDCFHPKPLRAPALSSCLCLFSYSLPLFFAAVRLCSLSHVMFPFVLMVVFLMEYVNSMVQGSIDRRGMVCIVLVVELLVDESLKNE